MEFLKEKYGFNIERFNPKENIFHAIYILDHHTGALFASNKYSNNLGFSDTPEDLISSFLNAMNLFINEINQDEEIQEINFKKMRILYEKRGRLMVIAITKKISLEMEKYYVHEILNDFYRRFEQKIIQFKGLIDPAMLDYKERLKSFNLSNSWTTRNLFEYY
ncbi:MAG: hypothetical protein ACFFBP_10300 [Promethearchaeota archaeon]